MHDAMNEGISKSVQSIDLTNHPKVIFFNMGFVEIDQRPRGLREIWGGLGLMICDEARHHGIPPERRQRDHSMLGACGDSVWRGLAPVRSVKRVRN
jgi:hypothetical protein